MYIYDYSQPTIGIDFIGKNITHKQVGCRLQLWDTAGQERYRSLIPSYLKDAICAVFVFDNSSTLFQHRRIVNIAAPGKLDLTLQAEQILEDSDDAMREQN